jgi:hypothetical protein
MTRLPALAYHCRQGTGRIVLGASVVFTGPRREAYRSSGPPPPCTSVLSTKHSLPWSRTQILQDMVVRYTDFLADKRLEPVDGQLTSSSAVSYARSTWEDVGHGHLKTDGITHDDERGDSISGRQLERGSCVIRLPRRTYVDCWSCVMNVDGVSIVATDERLFASADISSVPMVACLAKDVLLGRREPINTSSIATG